ncbi:MAG: family 78 glycoside hydrolase catalytic domain [Clostridia bacterium]|nr:family 78 glycoside hydrolase catalytic domain [Clostridia bacterium]
MKKKFISATKEYTTLEKHLSAPLFRRTFTLDCVPDTATLSVCGLGFYILFINGKNITKGHIAPYISNPDDVCYYDTYDVRPYLTAGENVIGVMLGNGFLNCLGGAVWDLDKAPYRAAPMLALELCCQMGENTLLIEADEQFLTHPSAITFDDLRLGESFDARLDPTGWLLGGYDTAGWQQAFAVTPPRGILRYCTAEPVTVLRTKAPVSVTSTEDGYLYDFGENNAGVPQLSIAGARGQTVTIWLGEQLHEGKFYNGNIRFYYDYCDYYKTHNQTLRYTCKGEGREEYTPHFHYAGFRYALVQGITEEQATKDLLTYHIMGSALTEIGGFSCSDEKANAVFEMVKRSDRANYFYFPTDCPHREKNGWTGDIAISAPHMTMLYDTEVSYREWLLNVRLAQNTEGALPGIVPTAGWGFAWGNGPAWDRVLFELPFVLFKYRGCLDVIRENAHAMMRYLQYIMSRQGENGTIAVGLGDWVPVDLSCDKYKAPLALTDTVMVMDMARKAAEMFAAIGLSHEASYAEGIYRTLRATVRARFVDPDTLVVAGHCQTSQAVALHFGIFEETERPRATAELVRLVHEAGDAFDCGFLGLFAIFHALAENGETALAYHLAMRAEYPSYAWLLSQGYTTLPEHFRKRIPYTESQNHHFFGDIARFFMVHIAGLEVLDAKTVRIAPKPVSELTEASAYYDLPAGRVSVSWKKNADGSVLVTHEAPQGVTVLV